MKAKLADLLTVVVTLCALVVTGLVVRRELFSGAPRGAPERIRTVENWEALAATGSLLGPRDAPARIVEFSDFQCPFCARVGPDLEGLREKYPGQVSIVYRHLPLEQIHPHALAAANASECAGAQGRFEAYHDALFQQQDSIGTRSWESFARDAGVADLPGFSRCVAEGRFEPRVKQDMEEAKRIGVRGTPVFIFDGKMVSGAGVVPQLTAWVEEALGGG